MFPGSKLKTSIQPPSSGKITKIRDRKNYALVPQFFVLFSQYMLLFGVL